MSKYFPASPIIMMFMIILLSSIELRGQHRHDHLLIDAQPLFQRIDLEVENGTLSKEEAILQKFYAGLQPNRLEERFLELRSEPIKCLTPVMVEYWSYRDQMNSVIVDEIEQMISLPHSDAEHSYLSPDGNFIIYYNTTGNDAVPPEVTNEMGVPDYVVQTAFAADSSYRHQIETLGFKDFIKDEPYQISYMSSGSLYGFTVSSGTTSRIEINSNFEGFPPNTHKSGDQIGALYVTIAHELKHASQYEINRLDRSKDTGKVDWIEMDATLMEEVVFDDVNDYYNYIMSYDSEREVWDRSKPRNNSIFGKPEIATPGAYSHVTWMIYFYEKFGINFWVQVWDDIDNDIRTKTPDRELLTFLEVIDRVLASKETSLIAEHLKNHKWHMSSGPDYSGYDFGFSDHENYPSSKFKESVQLSPNISTIVPNQRLSPFGASYYDLNPSSSSLGQPMVTLESDINGVGVGVVGFFIDGSVKTQISMNPNSNIQTVQTTWSWKEIADFNVVVINSKLNMVANYDLEISSITPENDLITQNYPNPFNPNTSIVFALNDRKDVQIDVYDTIGRKVATLVNDRLNSGFHRITFNGSGLASGVYIYRIVTDETVISKKMLLIK
ncbi:MAG: T9SS type A sorting domain-containing protein [Balneolaceae bacterium]